MKSVITNSLDNKAAPYVKMDSAKMTYVKMASVKMTYRISAPVAQVSSKNLCMCCRSIRFYLA